MDINWAGAVVAVGTVTIAIVAIVMYVGNKLWQYWQYIFDEEPSEGDGT